MTEENNEQAGGEATWRDSLPDDLKGHSALEGINDIPGLAKQYVHAQSMIGGDRVVKPGENATPEQMNEYYNALGRPVEANGYELKTPEGIDAKLGEDFAALAHKHGLSKTQAIGLFEDYTNGLQEGQVAHQATIAEKQEAGLAKMKEMWGAEADENLAIAKRALKIYGDEDGEFLNFLNESDLGNDPRMLQMFHKIGLQSAEDVAKSSGALSMGTKSAEDASAEISRMNMDPEVLAVMADSKHPQHSFMEAKLAKLYEVAYPETTAE